MRLTKLITLILTGLLLFQSAVAQNNKKDALQDPALATSDSAVLGFMEWKAARVHEAQQKVEQMNKNQGSAQVFQEGKTSAEASSAGEEQKLNFNVDVALQLNIQDYFSMYLKNLSVEEFKEATRKMSQDDVAELLLAYKNEQEKDKKIPLKFSKIPKSNAKSKKTDIQ